MCGNDHDRSFTIGQNGEAHTFDRLECAIAMLAPTCAHCDCRINSHGVEVDGEIFCCMNCMKESGGMKV
jgi:hypothetical protein